MKFLLDTLLIGLQLYWYFLLYSSGLIPSLLVIYIIVFALRQGYSTASFKKAHELTVGNYLGLLVLNGLWPIVVPIIWVTVLPYKIYSRAM
jgi:hypothetical protein